MIRSLHHIAIIVSSEAGVQFYRSLGFREEGRSDRGYDQVVLLTGYGVELEIFIDPNHPQHISDPETYGLRHVAFQAEDIETEWENMRSLAPEPIRVRSDGVRSFFVKDPDGLPIEIRE